MHGRWKISIQAWPFHGTKQEEVAPREREFLVEASDFDDANKQAQLLRLGILSHDKIWEAPIAGVVYVRE